MTEATKQKLAETQKNLLELQFVEEIGKKKKKRLE